MSQKPIAMDHLKQILQLKRDGVSIKEIVRRTGVSRNSVRKYLSKVGNPDVSFTNQELAYTAYNNEQLEADAKRLQNLFTYFNAKAGDLSKTGVTRQLLWHEYLVDYPDGYGYSQFCYHLQTYHRHRDLSMHMEYKPGDMIMIDFAGKKQYYVDAATGEHIACEVFVAILPFSGLIFCLTVHTQQTADLATCFNEMLRFYGGSPATILCDNVKTAVVRPSKYEPVFTDMCNQAGEHYGTTFSATRPYSPRDKAMVERAVKIIYTHVYAPLRHHQFTSLKSLNQAMHQQLMMLNDKPYKNTAHSRWYYYDVKEKASLRALPNEPFTPKKVVMLTVQRNYHVQLTENYHYYSVPYQHVGKKVKVLYDNRVVEVYLNHERIAVHLRQTHQNAYTTLAEHMPPDHQRMKEIKGWNKDDLLAKAAQIGSSATKAATLMLENSIYIEQNYKACFGMLMLQKKYGKDRLEAACSRALLGTRINYTMIKNILERGLDRMLILPENPIPLYENIRGKEHYQ